MGLFIDFASKGCPSVSLWPFATYANSFFLPDIFIYPIIFFQNVDMIFMDVHAHLWGLFHTLILMSICMERRWLVGDVAKAKSGPETSLTAYVYTDISYMG